jgi:hypothetical protein
LPVSEQVALARLAARNNAEWCHLVCQSHGVVGQFRPQAWTSATRTPAYYPDAVTLDGSATASALRPWIDTSTPGCSVKDSFAQLDLTALGLEVLVEAEWVHRPAEGPVPAVPDSLRWRRVLTAGALDQWQEAWGGEPAPGGVFRPVLLARDSIAVLAGYDGDRIAAGAIANRSAGAVGITNVFGPVDDPALAWAGALAAIVALFGGNAIVGYESGPSLDIAREYGFSPVGPLRVWS